MNQVSCRFSQYNDPEWDLGFTSLGECEKLRDNMELHLQVTYGTKIIACNLFSSKKGNVSWTFSWKKHLSVLFS